MPHVGRQMESALEGLGAMKVRTSVVNRFVPTTLLKARSYKVSTAVSQWRAELGRRFPNGVSVYFAIKEAVRAARSDAGMSGKFSLKQPVIPEHVLEACANSPLA